MDSPAPVPASAAPHARPSTAALFWLAQLGGWSAYATALTIPWLGRYTLASMLPNKAIIAGTGLLTSLGLRWVYRRAMRRAMRLEGLLAVAAGASMGGGIAWNTIASSLIGTSRLRDTLSLGDIGSTVPRFDGALYHALVLLTWSLLYLGARHYRDLVAERDRTRRAEGLAREARLLALRYQLSPHFLFNALNAISTLVVTRRNREATQMISKLAELLRASLEPPHQGMIPLSAEIDLVQRYVAIEQVRFGARLDVRIDVDDDARDAPVPAMILQPLVENAVRHAVAAREGPTRIRIRAWRTDATLALRVADDGPGVSERFGNGTGLGLANTRARLSELYGASHRFELGAPDGGGLQVDLVFPIPARQRPAPPPALMPA